LARLFLGQINHPPAYRGRPSAGWQSLRFAQQVPRTWLTPKTFLAAGVDAEAAQLKNPASMEAECHRRMRKVGWERPCGFCNAHSAR